MCFWNSDILFFVFVCCTQTDASIDRFCCEMQMQLSTCVVDIQNMWNVLLGNIYLYYEVADYVTSSMKGLPWLSLAAFIQSTFSCFFVYALQSLLMFFPCGLLIALSNWSFYPPERVKSLVWPKRTILKPDWILIILLICSHAWSALVETNGKALLVTDIFSSWRSRQVLGWLVFNPCIPAMCRSQNASIVFNPWQKVLLV